LINDSARPAPARVTVEAPARLHLGFIDLDRRAGRRFGSLGLALEGLTTRVTATRAPVTEIEGQETQRTTRYVARLHAALRWPHARITVENAIPAHAGLGSGTQLALAVGSALSRLAGQPMAPTEIAARLDRGARSGVGVGAFLQGGFLVDGGHGKSQGAPPLTVRAEFPAAWRVLLILDSAFEGLHGEDEVKAFDGLPALSQSISGHLCRLVLTRMLPGLVEANLDEFGPALAEMQRFIGDHFAPAQGGRFASARVAKALAWLEREGVACVGQSSWGPTGFAVLEGEARARQLQRRASERWSDELKLEFRLICGRNRGADIDVSDSPAAATAA
jgi:beta-ribofuranosylaminobenzene 5'-phosphate synthase